MTITLCNGCLREVAISAARYQETAGTDQCPHCGGDLCDCPGCLDTIRRLRAGERDRRALGLCDGPAFSWSPAGGCVEVAP
jgi:hypothetical protein